MRIVFQNAHRRFRRIETRTAALENLVAGVERALDPGAIIALAFGRHLAAIDRSGATVNGQSKFAFITFHIC